MNAKISTLGLALALSIPAATLADEPTLTSPTAEERAAEPRVAFWGNEPGRPYAEIDDYVTPAGFPDLGGFRLSGTAWMDVGYLTQDNTQVGAFDKDVYYAQGRVVLGTAFRRDYGGLFAEARAQFVAFDNEYTKSQYEPHTQDAFVRLGGRTWDVQVGRFYAWEPYWRGLGIDRYTAEEAGALGGPQIYRLDAAIGHKDESGQIAAHWFPAEWAALEVSSVYGQESGQNNVGVRPVVALRKWGFLLTGGYEYLSQTPQDTSNKVETTTKGFAGRLQYTIFGTTLALEGSQVQVDAIQIDGLVDGEKTLEKTSIGGFVQSDLSDFTLSVGGHLTSQDNEQGETNEHIQTFAAALYRLPIPGFSVWGVLGWARASIEDVDAGSSWENDMTSFRVRLEYRFR